VIQDIDQGKRFEAVIAKGENGAVGLEGGEARGVRDVAGLVGKVGADPGPSIFRGGS
jgi:hypothetical protein